MRIINVTNGSSPFGRHCQVCNGIIGMPNTVLEVTYYDDSYGDTDCYICKICIDKAHKEMNKEASDDA
jgi:hypothetical protein